MAASCYFVILLSAFLILHCECTSSPSSSSTSTSTYSNSSSTVAALYQVYQELELKAMKVSASPVSPSIEGAADLIRLYHQINIDKVKYKVGTNKKLRHEYAKFMASGRNNEFVMYYKLNQTALGRRMLLLFINQVVAPTARLSFGQPARATERTKDICTTAANRPHMVCLQSFKEMYAEMVHRMGQNVTLLTTPPGIGQFYRITGKIKVVRSEFSAVTVCHKQHFEEFGVYICHSLPHSQVRLVPLVGLENGVNVEALSICHMDTTSWSPQFHALVLMKMKPGTPLCHFLATDDLVWVNT